ncbi:hypothetical protein Acr_11g0016540 [Actinidia rufa]|uniref:Uncharacterized protein n=1 Tax=Actinidia rufa TaxID=165716 RepID=A0A7J0FF83_9ERIC|nr:hypothetical protein Acr_11g0016540 [Actinidia rufa]
MKAAAEVSDGGSLLLHCQEEGLYELSHELIFSSLWPINSEGCLRRKWVEKKCNLSEITESTQLVAVCRGAGLCLGRICYGALRAQRAEMSGSALPIDEGKVSRMQSCRSYGGAGSDYPPIGWRGRLLDPAQVVRPKDPAQVVKPKPITHFSRIRMKWERKRGSDSFVRGGAERVEDGGAPSLLHGQQWRHE